MHFEAEPRKGICGPSCFAIRDGEIFHPITPNPAPFPSASLLSPPSRASLLQPWSSVAPVTPKASFSVEPLSLTIRRSWNLYVPIPRRSATNSSPPLHSHQRAPFVSTWKLDRAPVPAVLTVGERRGEVVNRYLISIDNVYLPRHRLRNREIEMDRFILRFIESQR